MKVFLTGASGFVGSAVAAELLKAGHEVIGLARSDASVQKIRQAGANVHRGDITDLASLRKGAENADAIIHTGFIHDFSNYKQSCENDRLAIGAMSEVLKGSTRPIVVTSGLGLIKDFADEDSKVPATSEIPRTATEHAAQAAVEKGVHISVMRLPPSVHGAGDHGFVPMLIEMAREKGVSAYIGEGKNLWPAVHRFDAAKLYRLAIEKNVKGLNLHAVAEEGIEFRKIAEVIGRKLNVPVKGLTQNEVASHFTWFAHFAAMNVRAVSSKTRELFNWKPEGIGLLSDIDSEAYFKR